MVSPGEHPWVPGIRLMIALLALHTPPVGAVQLVVPSCSFLHGVVPDPLIRWRSRGHDVRGYPTPVVS